MTSLKPETNAAFDSYVHRVESELDDRAQGKRSFLWLDDHPANKASVRGGELVIQSLSGESGVSINDGLIHDWIGAVFLPGATNEKALAVLKNFNRHKNIYSEVIDSRTVSSSGSVVHGFWRLRKKKVITVVLDVNQTAHYREVKPGAWQIRAATDSISEVENPDAKDEKRLPPGEGHGYLWRLNAYWSLLQTDQGVFAECRTLSLSRPIPALLSWAVKPFVQSMPRESLRSTLEGTRQAVMR